MAVPLSPKATNTALGGPNANANTNANATTTATAKTPGPTSKKDGYATLHKAPGTQPKSPQTARTPSDSTNPPPEDGQGGSQFKKVSRRTSKPIINWFQRKLASTGRARRASEGHGARPKLPSFDPPSDGPNNAPPVPRQRKGTSASAVDRPKSESGAGESSLNSADVPPVPPLDTKDLVRLNEKLKNVPENEANGKADTESNPRSSIVGGPESMWSPSVAVEADEDASVRPLPPSSPPSPSPSHSSSSYLSDPRTFRSMAASTKPTTVLSIDVGNGMAHIAEAPLTPMSQVNRYPAHVRTSSQGAQSITFALPNASQSSPARSASPNGAPMQAPLHTVHHPRDNPRPSSPPPDNASVLTLASSAFGVPGARIGTGALLDMGGDSVSNFEETATDSTSQFAMGDEVDGERDVNASMRALRSRRSWESQASRWSARIGGTSLGPATPMGDRSLWGTSIRTGGQDDADSDPTSTGPTETRPKMGERSSSIPRAIPRALITDSAASAHGSADRHCPSPLATEFKPRDASEETTPQDDARPSTSSRATTPNNDTPLPEEGAKTDYFHNGDGTIVRPVKAIDDEATDDSRSVMTGTDVFVSAPSTPMGFN